MGSRMLLDAARDLQLVADAHGPILRREGRDDLAEQLEELLLALSTSAQELEAALQPGWVSGREGKG